MGRVYNYLLEVIKNNRAGFLTLLDPDRMSLNQIVELAICCDEAGADALLIGSSLLLTPYFDQTAIEIKKRIQTPLISFPGNAHQISRNVDCILFLSLISGRNPDFLIGEHIKAAPIVKEYGIEAIPTGYMLIQSDNLTSVEYISNTRAIPRDKSDIAMAHALAAEYLGMKLVFMDCGSGADNPVPNEMISAVKDYISIPLVIGGGIRTPEQAAEKVHAGADFVVTGTVLENNNCAPQLVAEFADAVHSAKRSKRMVTINPRN